MIVSSIILLDNPQTDGRRVIIEQHTDDQGCLQEVSYMANEDTDVDMKLIQHAQDLNIQDE